MVKEHKTDPNRYLKIVEGRPIQFRAFISTTDNQVGYRITVPLRTHNIREARRLRNYLEDFMLKAELARKRLCR